MIGKTLIHYKISTQIGRGGMGEVYQAKDTKLGREVAIKVLPEEFALDTDRVARFQREAKLLASLNHPNIAAIYGLEESEDTHFLVMELIEGQTLNDRIKSGPIPVEEALKLALQMAEALEAAHEKGVIHRDLKPANIKVTPDGKVRILDFGLAKAYAGDQDKINLADSPTISAAATQQGVILGTAAYMSPEQAKGKSVDKRADIWAFGCVLFEMLTGQTAFQGEDVSETLASVIKGDSNLTLLSANIHPRVREVISRCLQKDMRKRYSSIGDARYEIEQALSDPSGILVEPVTTVKPTKKLRVGLSWVAGALILGLIIAGIAVWYLKPFPPAEPKQVMRFDYDLPDGQEFTREAYKSVAVSADGKMIVYVANNRLYLKNANEFDARPIQGTDEDPMGPFFSPDGQWIGYSTGNGQLKKISIMGGVPVTVCDSASFLGAIWGTDNRIVFSNVNSIMRVSANGGTPEEIITGDDMLFFPQILPDGKSVLFSVFDEEGNFHVSVGSLESGQRKDLFAGFPAQYLQTGHIVYGLENQNNLAAIGFNPDTLETIGGPVPLIEDAYRLAPNTTTNSVISDSGTLVYIPGRTGTTFVQKTLVWVDREGHEEPIEEESNTYYAPNISPDGTQIALNITVDGNTDIYVYDLVRKTTTRLTFDDAADYLPIWTPDGKQIIFDSERAGRESIFCKAADGTGKAEELLSVPNGWAWPFSLSKDGSTLFFGQATTTSGDDIGTLSMIDDGRTPKLLLQDEYAEKDPMISPDGRWLAYMSDESGQYEIFVRPFPDVDRGGKFQVSRNGGNNPLWSPDGRELFYRNGDATMVVPVEIEPTFRLGNPEVLFEGEYFQSSFENGRITSWDITQDGKRFLMMKEAEQTEEDSTQGRPRRINIVLNWFVELKERVPVD